MDFTTAIFILFFSLPDFRPAALRLFPPSPSSSPGCVLFFVAFFLLHFSHGSTPLHRPSISSPSFLFLLFYSRFDPLATFNCSRLVLKSVSHRAVFSPADRRRKPSHRRSGRHISRSRRFHYFSWLAGTFNQRNRELSITFSKCHVFFFIYKKKIIYILPSHKLRLQSLYVSCTYISYFSYFIYARSVYI